MNNLPINNIHQLDSKLTQKNNINYESNLMMNNLKEVKLQKQNIRFEHAVKLTHKTIV